MFVSLQPGFPLMCIVYMPLLFIAVVFIYQYQQANNYMNSKAIYTIHTKGKSGRKLTNIKDGQFNVVWLLCTLLYSLYLSTWVQAITDRPPQHSSFVFMYINVCIVWVYFLSYFWDCSLASFWYVRYIGMPLLSIPILFNDITCICKQYI